MNLGVVGVEEPNPTTKNLAIVGLRYAPPNLHLFLYFQSDKKGLISPCPWSEFMYRKHYLN